MLFYGRLALDLVSAWPLACLHSMRPLAKIRATAWPPMLQGAKEDAEAVGKGADIVMHKAKEAAEQLPTALEHLPGSAATLQARAEAAGTVARVQAGRSLAGLAGLGSKLVLGTHDLLEQIRWVPHVAALAVHWCSML